MDMHLVFHLRKTRVTYSQFNTLAIFVSILQAPIWEWDPGHAALPGASRRSRGFLSKGLQERNRGNSNAGKYRRKSSPVARSGSKSGCELAAVPGAEELKGWTWRRVAYKKKRTLRRPFEGSALCSSFVLEALGLVRSHEALRATRVRSTAWPFSWGAAPSLWSSPFLHRSC